MKSYFKFFQKDIIAAIPLIILSVFLFYNRKPNSHPGEAAASTTLSSSDLRKLFVSMYQVHVEQNVEEGTFNQISDSMLPRYLRGLGFKSGTVLKNAIICTKSDGSIPHSLGFWFFPGEPDSWEGITIMQDRSDPLEILYTAKEGIRPNLDSRVEPER